MCRVISTVISTGAVTHLELEEIVARAVAELLPRRVARVEARDLRVRQVRPLRVRNVVPAEGEDSRRADVDPDDRVAEELEAVDDRVRRLARRAAHDILVRRVPAKRRRGRPVRHEVDPQQLRAERGAARRNRGGGSRADAVREGAATRERDRGTRWRARPRAPSDGQTESREKEKEGVVCVVAGGQRERRARSISTIRRTPPGGYGRRSAPASRAAPRCVTVIARDRPSRFGRRPLPRNTLERATAAVARTPHLKKERRTRGGGGGGRWSEGGGWEACRRT